MKYIRKIPAADKERGEELSRAGWKSLKEPRSVAMATLCALPIALVLGGIVIWMIHWLDPSLFDFLQDGSLHLTIGFNVMTLVYVIIFFAFMLLHELIHALFIPGFITSDKAYWGFNGAVGFVYTEEPIGKGRFIIVSLMPLVLLSVVLPVVLALLGWLNGYAVFLCLMNAVGSCVDILNILIVVFQVPNKSRLINNGFKTYYKRAGDAPAVSYET